jgi:hypothetical protein
MRQGKDVAAAERPALVVFATPKLGFRMKMIADQTAGM